MNKLRKSLVVGVMVLTIAAMTGALNISSANASASAGDLIKMSGNAAVYYLGADGKRYVFPNSTTYNSWYADFSGVVTIPATELQSYLLGGNVVMRPGTKLVKITTDPSVYAVEPNGVLRKIQSEAQAAALYGTNWNKRIVDVPDSYFTNYTIGTALANGEIPAGSLVKNAGSSAVYYFDGTNYRSVATEAALTANRFSMANVLTLTSAITAGGTAISAAEAALIKTSQGGTTTGPVITGSGLMVSLNSATAAANTVINGQALAELASFNLTAANDGAAKVTTIKIKRIGISSDSAIGNLYLYEGNTKLTDNASFGSNYASFSNASGIITVAAGQTRTITVKGDIAASTGNIGVAINAASDIVASAATVSGSFPVQGNLMSMTSVTDLATVSLGAVTHGATTINAGTMSATVWSSPVTVTNKAVNLKYIAFKQVGSIASDALQNLTLYVNGVQAGNSASINSDNKVIFDLSAAPVKLNTGATTVELRADIVKGSSRTFSFAMQVASDLVVTDTNYNVNVTATGSGINDSATSTINSGSVSISKDSTFSTTDVVKNSSNVVLGRYTMKAFGEDMKVDSLTVVPTFTGTSTSTEGLNDLSIFVNGTQVGSSQNYIKSSAGAFPSNPVFGTNNLFTITAGQTVSVEIRGTLNLTSGTSVTAVQNDLKVLANKLGGVTSFATSPASDTTYTGSNLNITTGSMSIAKNTLVQDQYLVKNTSAQKIGSYIIQAGNAEAVRVTNLAVTLSGTANLTDLSNLYVSENTTPVVPQSANNFPVNFILTANQSKTIDVYADLGNITNASTTITALTVTATGQSTNTSVGGSAVTGQTITIQTGTLANPTLVTNAPVSGLVTGGSTPVAATYKFVATNGSATLNELVFKVTRTATTSSSTVVSTITVGTVTAPVVCGTDCKATLTGLNIAIPAGVQGYNVEVKPAYNNVTSANQGGATTNTDVRLDLASMKYTIAGVQTPTTLDVPSNVMVLVASKPTVTLASDNPVGMSSGYAAGATSDVLHFTVANSNSAKPLNLHAITVTPTWSGALTATTTQLIKVYDKNDLTTVLGSATSTVSGTKVNIALTNDFVVTNSNDFVIKADTTGLTTAGNSYRLDLTSADTFGSGTDWQWNDSTVAAGTYANGTYVKNLPLTGNTFVK